MLKLAELILFMDIVNQILIIRAKEVAMSVLSDELKNAILDEDFYLTNDILERLKAEENGESYIHDLMEFMSENPALDYGMPGPIIHFIESYGIDKYIDTQIHY